MVRKEMTRPNGRDYKKAHFHVLKHTDCITPYIEEHLVKLRKTHPSNKSITRQHNCLFNNWLANRLRDVRLDDDTLRCMSTGPTWQVNQYQGYKISGYTFSTTKRDGMKLTQNSGVCYDAVKDRKSVV